MAFKLAKGSLFAVLLRSPWWYSGLIGLFLMLLSLPIADGKYVILGITAALPFFAIAGYSAYLQSKRPSQKRIVAVYEQAQRMRHTEIAQRIANCYTQIGYESKAFKGQAADLELTRGRRTVLLASKRFKAGNTGVEPLKQLVAAGQTAQTTRYLYVALGEISATARKYANLNSIEIVQASELAAYFDGQIQIE